MASLLPPESEDTSQAVFLVPELIPSPLQDLAFPHGGPYKIPFSPFLQLFEVLFTPI